MGELAEAILPNEKQIVDANIKLQVQESLIRLILDTLPEESRSIIMEKATDLYSHEFDNDTTELMRKSALDYLARAFQVR